MRLRFRPIVMLLLLVTTLPAFAQWQWGHPRPPRAGACFYKDPGFRGDFFCLKAGERWPSMPGGFNDRVSSIRVFGSARARIFNGDNFSGVNLFVGRSVDDLRRVRVSGDRSKSWNDRISSIAVFDPDRDEWRDRR